MAKLWITESDGLDIEGHPLGNMVAAIAMPATAVQTPVTFSTATQSAAFGSTTRIVRLCADTACHVLFGADPTATTNSTRLPADTPEYFFVTAGHKLSVIAAA